MTRILIAGSMAMGLACVPTSDEPEVLLEPGTLLLSSSLDGIATVRAPEVGSGQGAAVWTQPPEHFVQTLHGQGVLLDADGQWLRFRVRDPDTGAPNLQLPVGTMSMWLRPAFPVLDGQARDLFAVLDDDGHGLRMTKAGHEHDNALRIELVDLDDRVHVTTVDADQLPWLLLDWVQVHVVWDATGASEQHVRVWVDGVELPYAEHSEGAIDLPELPDDTHVYWGAWGVDDPQALRGTVDELQVWAGVVEP